MKFDRVRSRLTITTSAPRSASSRAVANPSPLVAPVMRTVFPLIDISLSGAALNFSRPSARQSLEASFAYYPWQLGVIGESSSNSGQGSPHLRSADPLGRFGA